MEPYNVKALVYKTLNSMSELKIVSPSYPNKFTVFPIAIYSTTQSSYIRNAYQEETDTEWKITIDLYNDKGSLTQIKNKLIAKFSAMGFSNNIGDQDLNGITRVVLVFTGIVDNTSKRVYQKDEIMKNVKLYSDALKLDLQRFAIDSSEGLVGTGTKLERSEDGSTWEEIADIKTIPELGGDTEKVDVTTLADDRRKQVEGIQNASNVQFQAVYKGASFAKALQQAGDRKQYQWKVTYPDGMTATMRGSYNIKFAAVAVNGALGYTITITVSDGPHFTAAPGSDTPKG